jgi:pimeloyl-ACP methyl ester carboxylesterase
MKQFRDWLGRIGYEPHDSGIGFNADCPNLLIRTRLFETIDRAYSSTKRKVHLVGHSLGGMLARAAASQLPDRIESVITLGAPINNVACHPSILRLAEMIRAQILQRNGESVLPACYTGKCTCDYLTSLRNDFPSSIRQTAIYTRMDGVVDWRVCITGDKKVDVEVSATHIGMVFSPLVYSVVANRLAGM